MGAVDIGIDSNGLLYPIKPAGHGGCILEQAGYVTVCADCFDEDDEVDQLRITQELIYHARCIEEDLPGALLSDDAWAIFFGSKSGSIAWADHERMARCREAAVTLLAMHGTRL